MHGNHGKKLTYTFGYLLCHGLGSNQHAALAANKNPPAVRAAHQASAAAAAAGLLVAAAPEKTLDAAGAAAASTRVVEEKHGCVEITVFPMSRRQQYRTTAPASMSWDAIGAVEYGCQYHVTDTVWFQKASAFPKHETLRNCLNPWPRNTQVRSAQCHVKRKKVCFFRLVLILK